MLRTEVQSDPGRLYDAALQAPVWTLVRLAEIVSAAYDAMENPNDGRSSDAMLEWFPKIAKALDDAGLLIR